MAGYWESRKHLEYYRTVRQILEALGSLPSILDIGSWDTPVATWGTFGMRYTLDPRERPALPNVTRVFGRWPDAVDRFADSVSVVTCLQTIEHVEDPRSFVDAIFAVAEQHVVISVPYKWPAGATPYHHHDPIDKAKLELWTRRKCTRKHIVTDDGGQRLIAEYCIQPESRD